ncbi:MAG: PelD GGDEF domain-containing protein [Sulfurimonas sp.]|nr:PelD GGDEF domain-containing protein [Sulfurimonas sp.]
MKVKHSRVQERTLLESALKIIHDYAYAETLAIVALYLLVGYLINPEDACMLHREVPYVLVLLAVITLFHGFENGVLAMGIVTFAMWYFYPSFEHVQFLVVLMMTMIYSEFHYYWIKKIQTAEINADYRGVKLDELAKAFYTLKISHDQLEKNYVIKPMSIRNSIEQILNKNREIGTEHDTTQRDREYYTNFLVLLEKSFNVDSAIIIYKKDDQSNEPLSEITANIVYGHNIQEEEKTEEIFKNYLVDKAVSRMTAIYISDKFGEPTTTSDISNDYIAALPAIQSGKVVSVLIIKKMPFMAFNRENLTSISILMEYLSIEMRHKDVLQLTGEIEIIKDEKFRFEYARLKYLYEKYQVASIVLVLRIDNELQATRAYEKVVKMLRSLDMVTIVEQNELYYITLMFPLHDKAAALGYLNRLLGALREEKDKNFDYMTFDFSQIGLLNKYLREDYGK